MLDGDRVRSKKRGLCRVFLTASVRSSRLRSAVACGSAASNCAYRSAALRPPSGALPSLGSIGSFTLAKEQIVRFALDRLAGLEAKGPGARTPPAARRLTAGLAGLDVVAGRVLGRAAVDLLPDVVKVIALAQRRDNCH